VTSTSSSREALVSPAVWIVCLAAVASSIAVALRPKPARPDLLLWTFARPHMEMLGPVLAEWNAEGGRPQSGALLLTTDALQRRLLSGFWSGTPLPDLVEVHAGIAAQVFRGPVDDIGFLDLTDRLRESGLLDHINPPSLVPWTSRGRIFGLPHDVHPVLLGYRADIIEAAGIHLETIETWDDFVRALRPLMADADRDGRPDRYLINLWATNPELIEVLMLQAGGGLFDAQERLILASEINAMTLATVVSWMVGPDRIAINAPEFDAAGNRLRLEGVVLCSLLPDWLAGAWQSDLPGLAGKVKLMPLPAWTPGGRRTSVMGGTMLGLPREGRNIEQAWALAQRLYVNRDVARRLYRDAGIVTAVRTFWDDPIFDEPSAFFSGQPAGRLYVDQAPHVPPRSSSPYQRLALAALGDAAMALKTDAERDALFRPEQLLPLARAHLERGEQRVRQLIRRNVFFEAGEEAD
jgi:arabinosaccharide transport system substrate-binding protein